MWGVSITLGRSLLMAPFIGGPSLYLQDLYRPTESIWPAVPQPYPSCHYCNRLHVQSPESVEWYHSEHRFLLQLPCSAWKFIDVGTPTTTPETVLSPDPAASFSGRCSHTMCILHT